MFDYTHGCLLKEKRSNCFCFAMKISAWNVHLIKTVVFSFELLVLTSNVWQGFFGTTIIHERLLSSPVVRRPSSLLIRVESSTLDLPLTFHSPRTEWLIWCLEPTLENVCWPISLVVELLISHISLLFLPTQHSWALLVCVDVRTYMSVSLILLSFSWFK